MKKRILSIVLALAMMLSLLPATVLAADNVATGYKVVPAANVAEVTFGQEVIITVKVTGGEYYGLDYVLQYDATKFEYVKETGNNDPNENFYVADYGTSGGVGEIGLTAISNVENGEYKAYDADSVLGTFKFKAKVLDEEATATFEFNQSYIETTDGADGSFATGDAPSVLSESVDVKIVMNAGLSEETGADIDGDGNIDEDEDGKVDDDAKLGDDNGFTYTVQYNGEAHKIPAITSKAANAEVKYYNAATGQYDLAYTAVSEQTDVGEYEVKYQVTAPGYATIEGVVTLKITPITVGINWPDATSFQYKKIEGVAKTHKVEPEVTGILSADAGDVSWTTTGTSASEVGTYTAAVMGFSGDKAGNYALPANGLSIGWSIGKGTMSEDFTIVINPNGGEGGLTYDGTEQPAIKTDDEDSFKIPDGYTVEYTYTNPETEEEITTNTVPTFEDAGEYSVTVTVKDPEEQYVPYEREIIFKINPKPVTITVENAEKFFGDADPEFTGSVDGLVNSNDLGEIKYDRVGNDEALGENNATKTYADVLDATFTANGNYAVTVEKGEFTIKALTVDDDGNDIGRDDGSYAVEIIPEYVRGNNVSYDLVLVYTDANATFTYAGKEMIEITNSGYKYGVVFKEGEGADNTAYNAAPSAKHIYAYVVKVVEEEARADKVSYVAHNGEDVVDCSGYDVNASGRVELRDAMLVQSIYNAVENYMGNQANLLRADVSRDKHVDVLDDASKVIYVMQHLNG